MTFKLELLGKYVKVIGGFAFKSEQFTEEGIPIVRISDIQGGTVSVNKVARIPEAFVGKGDQYAIEPGDILIAMSGATTGKIGLVPQSLNGLILQNQRVGNFKVTAPEKIHKPYLKHFVCTTAYQHQIFSTMAGAAQPNISSKQLENIQIPIPPIPEQRLIAAILDQADALRTKRQEALAQLDSLTQSIFVEMFGDAQTIFNKWPTKKLGEILDFLTSGSRGWAEYYADSGALFLRIQNVCKDELKLDDVAFVNAPDSTEAKRTKVQEGDVLLSITADLGRTAVIPAGLGNAHINQHLSILRTSAVIPKYLSAFLTSPAGQREILGRDKHGVKAGLNFDDIRSFRIPMPPQLLQHYFCQKVETVVKQRVLHQQALIELEALFSSLQHRAFRGEL